MRRKIRNLSKCRKSGKKLKKERKERVSIVTVTKEEILLKELEKLSVGSFKNLKYPPIMDADPIFAANSLTLEDEKNVLALMKDTYANLKKESQVNTALEHSILYSNLNFEWFASFTIELARLNNSEVNIPYEYLPLNKATDLFFFPPLKIRQGKVIPDLQGGAQADPIIQHRAFYISYAYEAADFREGYPAWYMLLNTTIYEQYNYRTGVRARIDFNNGEFHYYIAGASDNWRQIIGVPLEMDKIIMSLLFKN